MELLVRARDSIVKGVALGRTVKSWGLSLFVRGKTCRFFSLTRQHEDLTASAEGLLSYGCCKTHTEGKYMAKELRSLIVVSAVKDTIKEEEMRSGDEFVEALNAKVHELVKEAIARARATTERRSGQRTSESWPRRS